LPRRLGMRRRRLGQVRVAEDLLLQTGSDRLRTAGPARIVLQLRLDMRNRLLRLIQIRLDVGCDAPRVRFAQTLRALDDRLLRTVEKEIEQQPEKERQRKQRCVEEAAECQVFEMVSYARR